MSKVHAWPSRVLPVILTCHPHVVLICPHFPVVSSLSKMPNPELPLPSIITRALILSTLLIASCWGVLLIAANDQASGTFLWFKSHLKGSFLCIQASDASVAWLKWASEIGWGCLRINAFSIIVYVSLSFGISWDGRWLWISILKARTDGHSSLEHKVGWAGTEFGSSVNSC